MAIPTAKVKIEILNIFGLSPAAMVGGNIRYARAVVQAGSNPQLNTPRSRPIPDAGGTFDLTAEAVPWTIEVNLDPGDAVSILVRIGQDLGDDPPPADVVVSGTVADPWAGGVKTFGASPGIFVRLTTTLIDPTDAGYLARAAAAGISGALVIPQGFLVRFADIQGLYKPSPPAPPPAPGSTHVAGYISDDNLGRIFTNRRPDGTWTRDTQYIDVEVKVVAFGAATIPAGAQVRWTITDPDDPTNDASSYHRDWGAYVDPNDYDAAGKPVGAHAGDNVGAVSPGNADETKLFGAGVGGTARWATATGGPAPAPASSAQAASPLTVVDPKNGTTSVRIHCPNVLGTNMILGAELTGTPAAIPVHNAATGVMTMWSRIDVEVKRMAGAVSIAGALPTIPPFFLPACVQLDFQPEATVAGALDKPTIAATEDLEDTGTSAWVNAAFTNKSKGGWFFLGAARLASPLSLGTLPVPIFEGTTYTLGVTGNRPWVQVKGSFMNASYVRIAWKDGGKEQSAGFSVGSRTTVGTDTRIFLNGNDVTPEFTGHDADGSLDHATASYRQYFPQHELAPGAAALSPGGFGVPAAGARVSVHKPGAVFTDGISPTLTAGGTDYFGGRTVLFTATPSHTAYFVLAPDKPTVTRTAGAGSFAAGRDVYIVAAFVNGRGEGRASKAFVGTGTAAGDRFSVSAPTLTPWHSALTGANVITGYNVYAADVAAGALAPPRTEFKKVNAAPVALGTATLLDKPGTGAAPPASLATITPALPVRDFDAGIVTTVAHEFIHAFGMPHKCGNWNWRTPRVHSCCMNYFNTWLVGPAPGFKLLPNTVDKQGNDMCGRHLMEIRRVHLERNVALKGVGW